MTIRGQFILTALLFAMMLAAISASAIVTGGLVETATGQEAIAQSIADGASDLGYLSSDYVIHRESPQLSRWQSSFASFSSDIAGLHVDRPEQQALLRNIQANARRLKEVFDSVVSGSPEGGALDPALLQVSWSRLTVQSQGLVSDASRLSRLLHEEAIQLERSNVLVLYAVIGLFGAYFVATYFLIQRRMLKSIAALKAGAAFIGSGNLDFKVKEKTKDEVGDLARAFNRMTADLKTVIASKAELEREIDERKRIQGQLESVSAQRQLALDAARMGWWHYDPATRISWWDERYKDIFQVTGYRQPNDEILKRLHPEDLPGVWARVEAALDPVNPQTYSAEYRILLPDGSIRWIEAHGSATFEGAGKDRHAVSLIGTVADITERKRAEAEISHLASFPELNPNPVVELDGAGTIMYANPEARNRFPDLLAEGGRHPFLTAAVTTILEGETHPDNIDVSIGDSWYEQALAYLPSTRSYRLYALDITERKRAEEELRQRTAALEVANSELESFCYSVSHDLRAPLRSMDGFSTALLEDYADKLDDEGRRYLRIVQESANAMSGLIDDLLKLSRVTRSDMIPEEVDLGDIAREVVLGLEKAEPDRRVEVAIGEDLTARGDRSLLRLALENLLGNAWKFSGKVASPRIELGTVQHHGERVYFVRDNGAGFDMSYANKLFRPFQRLHKSSEFSGTGIGLATVQRIIRRHGGRIWAESKVGEGATFYFTLD